MKSKCLIVMMQCAIVASFFFASASRASRVPRIELLREIHVPGTSVLLSDLLPEGAPVALRKRASEIALGTAPQFGNSRILEQVALSTRMGSSPGAFPEIVIPDRVVIWRESRPITLSEVFEAICKSLPRTGKNQWAALRPADLLLQSQVLVSPGDAGLQVLRAETDAALGRARFLLWPSKDPKVVPFFVTARLDKIPAIALVAHGSTIRRETEGPQAPHGPADPARRAILVSAGERATLVLHSDVMRMITDVIPLERGALGARIRVRSADTGKVFSAQVDGRAHLELRF